LTVDEQFSPVSITPINNVSRRIKVLITWLRAYRAGPVVFSDSDQLS
jgi:hypothetical protein